MNINLQRQMAMLKVTVDIFSGRPNPSWVMDEVDAKSLLDKVTKNPETIAKRDSGYQELGYRGIILEPLSDKIMDEYELSPSFAIANGASKDESKGLEIAKSLINSMPVAQNEKSGILTPLNNALQKMILEKMDLFPEVVSRKMPEPPAVARKEQRIGFEEPDVSDMQEKKGVDSYGVHCYYHTWWFNPGFWNNDPNVKRCNNCYNYARNWRTDNFAQPGYASGYSHHLTCDSVTNAALSDGAHRRYDCFPESENPRWLMAMVIWPGHDYHWYRLSREKFWGHKPGNTEARNYDNSHATIWNPETCNRGDYTQFCGYFYACKSMKIKGYRCP
jgi:hypothetical protein